GDGPCRVASGEKVIRKLGGVRVEMVGVHRGDRVSELQMPSPAVWSHELIVQRLPAQRVPEGVDHLRPFLSLRKKLQLQTVGDHFVDVLLEEATCRYEHRYIEPVAGERREVEHVNGDRCKGPNS